jgi:2-polyprenyl-3-methyl-5-hydroxy-6-metoxy-1,4-benzoquinol methylase/spore maturation protein CgeB
MPSEQTLITSSVHEELITSTTAEFRDCVAQAYLGKWGTREPTERVRNRIHWIAGQVRGETVLDVGCSEGILALLLAREGLRVTGIDVNRQALAYARELLSAERPEVQARVKLIEADFFTCPINQTFDTVVLGEILEHVVTPQRLLERAAACLAPGGRLVLTTPMGLAPAAEHKRSYVLSDVVALLKGRLQISHLSVRDGYICVVARKSNGRMAAESEASAELTSSRSLLRMTEEALVAAQRQLWEELDRRRAALLSQKAQIEKLQEELSAVGKELGSACQRQEQIQEALRKKEASEKLLKLRLARARRIVRARRDQVRKLKAELSQLQQAQADLKREQTRLAAELERAQATPALVLALPASEGRCELRAEPIWVEAAIAPNSSYELRGKYLAPPQVVRGDGLVSFCFLDRDSRPITGNYPGMSRSEKAGQFMYLPSGTAGQEFVLPFVSPAEASAVRLGFRRWNASALTLGGSVHLVPRPPVVSSHDGVGRLPAAPKIEFRPVELPNRPPRFSVRMAAIMDEFTRWCFQPECHLVLIRPDDWKTRLAAEKPDLLFVESAWRGNDDAWRYLIRGSEPIREGPLKELVDWCREHGIPTVFWNKEDPPHFEDFVHAARLFDYVFTTDANCVPKYREALGHERIDVLPFAIQPAIHNPINAQRDVVGQVCFAGAYYPRHTVRGDDMDVLLRPARSRGLTIFDRNYGQPWAERHRFPDEYHKAIRGGLPYAQMLDAYKRFRVFLNVNSVKDSPTMFSRRVLELLACGTPVISAYALGIEQRLGPDAVALVKSEEEAVRWMDLLLRNPDLAARMVLRGQRRIFSEHTCEQRVRKVMATIGRPLPEKVPRVCIATSTNRPAMLENIIANYQRQAWPCKELVLVLNSDQFDLEEVRRRVAEIPGARVLQVPESRTLGECLNRSIDESDSEYWTKFDDDNYYAPHFLTDLLAAFSYTDAALVGKYSYYAHLEGSRCLALRYPGTEHRYVTFLAGSAMVVRREVLDQVRFPEQNSGEDTVFLRECAARGLRMYATDRFNYLVWRGARKEQHTWKIEDNEFLRACTIVAYGDNFREHVTV